MTLVKRVIIAIVLQIALVYVVFGTILYVYQRQFLYPADSKPLTDCTNLSNAQVVDENGVRGYMIDRSSTKLIIFFHGNGGRACDRSYIDDLAATAGYSLFLVEYPGYAGSGVASEDTLLAEARAVNDRFKDTSYQKVMIMSESIGTGPASYLVSQRDSIATNYLAITPYDSMEHVISWHYPFYPISLMLKDDYTPLVWLEGAHVKVPVTLVLAGNDEVVGLQQGKALYDGLSTWSPTMTTIQDVGHNSIYTSQEYQSYVLEYLEKI